MMTDNIGFGMCDRNGGCDVKDDGEQTEIYEEESSDDEHASALERYERKQSNVTGPSTVESLALSSDEQPVNIEENQEVKQIVPGNDINTAPEIVIQSTDERKKSEEAQEETEEKLLMDECERNMKKALNEGDIDKIRELITPYHLTKCSKNSLEKSLEVSYKLRQLAKSGGPDGDELKELAMAVENFAINLIEPLKSDDMKRAIFEGKDFDRVADIAVKYEQKKFVSHPVVYSLLMRRWTGYLYHLCSSSSIDKGWFMWILLNIWTVFDVLLFPVTHVLLYFVHIITGHVKKRRDRSFIKMRDTVKTTMKDFTLYRNEYSAIIHKGEESVILDFASINQANELLSNHIPQRRKLSVSDFSLVDNLQKARELLTTNQCRNKVLVFMTDEKSGESPKKLKREAEYLKAQGVKIISIAIGLNPDIKELQALASSEEDVILYLSEAKIPKVRSQILESIYGRDIFDQYVKYFTSPYFIFTRDTISYLALLGLHFAICLQPSTLNITFTEWAIFFFFLGRLLMEFDQAVSSGKDGSNERMVQKKHNCLMRLFIKLKEKLFQVMSQYVNDLWNVLDAIILAMYIIIVILRLIELASYQTVSKNRLLALTAGYMYGLNAMILSLRVFGSIMESKKVTGSIQIALFQIMVAVFAIFGQFLMVTVAFSLAFTKIFMSQISYDGGKNTSSNDWWKSMKYLAWSLLGRGSAESVGASDSTSDGLAEFLYVLFLVLGTVMLMNMMIALLSNTYQHVEDNAFHEWSFKKATTIRTYRTYHPVPVPFNVISLSVLLIRQFLKIILCIRCKKAIRKFTYKKKKQMEQMEGTLFSSLVEDLQSEYFAVYGYDFPMTENNKMDRVLKETEGSRHLVGHIAQRVFRYDWEETQHVKSKGWESKGIRIIGQQMTYTSCDCNGCATGSGKPRHGARYLAPLSREFPGFEVLVQESGERRLVSIGVVHEGYDLHKFPGWEGNT